MESGLLSSYNSFGDNVVFDLDVDNLAANPDNQAVSYTAQLKYDLRAMNLSKPIDDLVMGSPSLLQEPNSTRVVEALARAGDLPVVVEVADGSGNLINGIVGAPAGPVEATSKPSQASRLVKTIADKGDVSLTVNTSTFTDDQFKKGEPLLFVVNAKLPDDVCVPALLHTTAINQSSCEDILAGAVSETIKTMSNMT